MATKLLASFLAHLKRLFESLVMPPAPPPDDYWKDLADKIYSESLKSVSKDITPEDRVPDEYSCVQQITTILRRVLPTFPIMDSTIVLNSYLSKSPQWKKVTIPRHGDVHVFVTNSGNGTVKNGHAFICGKFISEDGTRWLMSNDSRNGQWSVNYTIASANKYYSVKGGMSPHYYRIV